MSNKEDIYCMYCGAKLLEEALIRYNETTGKQFTLIGKKFCPNSLDTRHPTGYVTRNE